MNHSHVISDEVIDIIQAAINRNEKWMASNNISDHDSFKVIRVDSIADVFRQIPYGQIFELNKNNPDANGQQIQNNKNIDLMNEKNFDYLKDQLKYTGFGEALQTEMKERMKDEQPEFTLFHKAEFGKDHTIAALHFKKSDQSDNYFFNKYDLSVRNDDKQDILQQTFYINNKEPSITLKEGYNLLSGRAVYKEELLNKQDEKYSAWLQLNLKETDAAGNYKMKPYHQNYGYDLEATLAKHPFKELLNEKEKERLMESLQRGNHQSVTLQLDGRE